ncbi:MAG: glycosyl hydrolase 2 galactose-binding domain-containing protein [Terriglobia bacterium]
MRKTPSHTGLMFALCILQPLGVGAAQSRVYPADPGVRLELSHGWAIQSSAKVREPGSVLSTTGFQPQGWYLTRVPSTVFATLVKNKVYPDPNFGMNLRSVPGISYPIGANFANIPMPPDSPFRPSWWYRIEFQLPEPDQGKTLWLHFDGINYRANIWLNGHPVADSNQVQGMYRTFEFNVTGIAQPGHVNTLAVEVFAPTPDDLSITWVDWNPMPPDKDMGLFHGVYLTTSGPVTVRNAQVMTHLDLAAIEEAHLTVAADVQNVTDHAIEGTVKATIGEVVVTQPIRLAAGETKRVSFTPGHYGQLNLSHPKLWWPYLLGPQNLYQLQVTFEAGGQVSDRETVQFGIRDITSEIDSQGHRLFKINGRNILIRGAGYAPSMLLAFSPQRQEDELRYVRDMHLNTVRLEGKMVDDHFFNLCDRYGILVMAGWCCCSHWERWRSWKPIDYTVAGESLRDQVRRLRNHPCILTWLYGSDNAPPPDAEKVYLKVIQDEHWPNPYIASASERTTLVGPTGVKMNGPYGYVAPSYWLEDHKRGGAFGFNTETSPGAAIPVMASIQEMLPKDHLWPIDEFWNYHAGGGVFKTTKIFSHALDARYGKATSLADYVEKSQLMTYEGERAMFEAFGRNKYTSTGVIQWMLNNAWPSMIWHLFDYYMRPGGGYFGAKKACEPLHVQYSYDDRSIVVVNSYYRSLPGYKVTAKVYNLDLTAKFSKTAALDIPPDSSTRVFALPDLQGLSKTYFVKLGLTDETGNQVSSNFYWLSTHPDVSDWDGSKWYYTPIKSYADLTGLKQLPEVKLKVSSHAEQNGKEEINRAIVENPTSHLAFFVHLRLLKGKGGKDVAPVLWQDNYFELMPGEKRQITATYRVSELEGSKPVIAADGWNVAADAQ